jgi:hypothetical protein
MAFKDYEEIVDKYCDAWNDILKKETNEENGWRKNAKNDTKDGRYAGR